LLLKRFLTLLLDNNLFFGTSDALGTAGDRRKKKTGCCEKNVTNQELVTAHLTVPVM